MKRLLGAVAVCAFLLDCGTPSTTESNAETKTKAAAPNPLREISAAGRVEPLSEEIKVGSEVTGRLEQVRVDEGDHVTKGQVLAVVSNRDYEARVAEARAEVHMREAELDRIVNGSRTQERQEALASTHAAEAVLSNAKAEMDRRDRLFQSGDISRSDAEQTEREYAVAKARLDEARQHYAFIDAGPRPDDKSRAEAGLELARAQLAEAESRLAKTVIRSPVTGIVLRRYRRAGESVTEGADSPVLTVADNSAVRVRVDVDESDVGRVQAGQKAYVTAEAYGDRKFWGRVFRVGKELGHKNIRTDDPAERIDTKVLETLVELDGHPDLPDGLRVNAFILTGNESGNAK